MKQAAVSTDGGTIDPALLRHALSLAARGAVVLTTAHGDDRFGLTATSVVAVPSDGVTVGVWMDNSSPHVPDVVRAGAYVVNVLGADHRRLAAEFTGPEDRTIQDVRVHTGRWGLPILSDAVAHVTCEVVEHLAGSAHSVLVGRAISVGVSPSARAPDLRAGSDRFDFARHDEVYGQVRDRVLGRVYAPGETIVVDELAAELGVDRSATSYALTRLSSDGSVRRDPEHGYVVVEFDVATSDDTFDAQLAIELGAIELCIDSAGPTDLARMRTSYQLMEAAFGDGRFVDFGAFFEASQALREHLVALPQNSLLVAAFADLSRRSQMTRTFGCSLGHAQSLLHAHRDLIQGLERSDALAARRAAQRYAVSAKQRMRSILKHTGGRI